MSLREAVGFEEEVEEVVKCGGLGVEAETEHAVEVEDRRVGVFGSGVGGDEEVEDASGGVWFSLQHSRDEIEGVAGWWHDRLRKKSAGSSGYDFFFFFLVRLFGVNLPVPD